MSDARRGRLVLLRHGESEANADDVFAGWLDVALTPTGVRQAREAGRTLDAGGVRPDVVHTSVLGRAVDTALSVLDTTAAPARLTTTWRLNERHYGVLQGWSKDEARQHFGRDRVERWRRSADATPPPLTGRPWLAQVRDLRYAVDGAREVRSESLSALRDRIEPYWREVLAPELDDGLVVLVVSHGNALRMLASLALVVPAEVAAGFEFGTAVPAELVPGPSATAGLARIAPIRVPST